MGQIPIDGCFVTTYVTPPAGAYFEEGFGIGYHIIMVLDIPMHQLMGGTQPNIERPEIR